MSKFSERLKIIRKAAGLSQEAAAQKLDIRYSTYRRYEQGGTEPTVSDAARIADYFAVSLDYLAGRSDERKNETTQKEEPT